MKDFRRWASGLAVILLFCGSSANADNFLGKLFGGRGIEGSGELATESREVGPFKKIKLSGSYDVFVTVGQKQKVTITFDDNLIDLIETRVRGRTLRIYSEESFSSQRGCRVDISVPELEMVALYGSGDVEVVDIDSDEFVLTISGSGDMTAEGRVGELDIRVSGSGDIDGRRLEAEDAYVQISGSGDVKVSVARSLDARISGSGDIDYWGSPEDISTRVSGSGDISRRR
jgi:hypothetical protein